jgi:integrase
MRFDPAQQWLGDVLDLQSRTKVRTNKRNPQLPVIEPLKPILTGWVQLPQEQAASRKTWWRKARVVLGLPDEVIAYTIRLTVLNYLEDGGVPRKQIEGAAGHAANGTTARHYLHCDPRKAPKLEAALTKFWGEACRSSSSMKAAITRMGLSSDT